jgi:hydrogenase maturation protease
MSTVVLGIGNPILSDDSVGIKAARLLGERFPDNPGVTVKEIYGGGLRLMEEMQGHESAIVVDAMLSGKRPPGSIMELGLSELQRTRNLASSHDTGLAEAMEAGRLAGLKLPSIVRIIGIEVSDVSTFGEGLTPRVEDALYRVVELVSEDIGRQG